MIIYIIVSVVATVIYRITKGEPIEVAQYLLVFIFWPILAGAYILSRDF